MLTYGQLREFAGGPTADPRAARRIALEARAERRSSAPRQARSMRKPEWAGGMPPAHSAPHAPRLPQSLPGVAASSNLGVRRRRR